MNKLIEYWETCNWEERDEFFEWLCSNFLDYIRARSHEFLIKKVLKKQCDNINCKKIKGD